MREKSAPSSSKISGVRPAVLAGLAERILKGDRASAARAISWIENEDPAAERLLKKIYPATGRAWVVGVTGPPGVGKSTLVASLLDQSRQQNRNVGALLVDPSSPFSGGALLGDRLRLASRTGDADVFVRSLASRGAVGGLAVSVWGARRVLEALGLDLIFIETVGAGQSDLEIAHCADTVVVVVMPGLGDDIQALKAGILEIADVLVVNKADHPDRDRTVTALRSFWGMGHTGFGGNSGDVPSAAANLDSSSAFSGKSSSGASAMRTGSKSTFPKWPASLVTTVATTGQGVAHLWNVLQDHRDYLDGSGERLLRRRRQAEAELLHYVQRQMFHAGPSPLLAREAERLEDRRSDPYTSCQKLLSRWARSAPPQKRAARRR